MERAAAFGARERTNLATRGLGEPERPLVLKRVLDIEVLLVVEDGDILAFGGVLLVLTLLATLGGNGNGREVDLLVGVCGCLHGSGHRDGLL